MAGQVGLPSTLRCLSHSKQETILGTLLVFLGFPPWKTRLTSDPRSTLRIWKTFLRYLARPEKTLFVSSEIAVLLTSISRIYVVCRLWAALVNNSISLVAMFLSTLRIQSFLSTRFVEAKKTFAGSKNSKKYLLGSSRRRSHSMELYFWDVFTLFLAKGYPSSAGVRASCWNLPYSCCKPSS